MSESRRALVDGMVGGFLAFLLVLFCAVAAIAFMDSSKELKALDQRILVLEQQQEKESD